MVRYISLGGDIVLVVISGVAGVGGYYKRE